MLYDNYKNKIKKIANVKNVLVFFRFVFLAIFVLIVLFVITFVSSKGKLKKGITMPSNINYGEEYNFDVETFFGGGLKYFEYREESQTEWTTEKPVKAGTYYVRAVTNKVFGSRTSAEYKFTINKINLDLIITSDTITYGDYPIYSATGLKNNDRISQITFAFDSFNKSTTNINIDLQSVVVNDSNGNNVTDCYTLLSNGKEVAFEKKDITINPEFEDEIVYSGNEVTYENTYTINTSLGYDDISVVEGKIYDLGGNEVHAILPGDYVVKINQYNIKHGEIDTTSNYNVTAMNKYFTIAKKEVIVNTNSDSKLYDGTYLTNNGFTCNGLIGEDRAALETIDLPSIKYYVDKGIKNTLSIKIYDKDNNDVTDSLYSIIYNYGTLSINKKPIVVTTTSNDTFPYDGATYSCATLSDISLLSGSFVNNDGFKLLDVVQPSISQPGVVENAIKYIIVDEFDNDVTNSYDVTNKFGTLTMYSKDITIAPSNITVKYGENYSVYEEKCFILVDTYTGFEEDIINSTTVELEYFLNGVSVTPKDARDDYEIRIKNYYTDDKYSINIKPNEYGTLKIEQKEIDIKLNEFDPSYTYNGQEIKYSDNYGNYTLVNGSKLEYDDTLKIMVDYYDSNNNHIDGAPINVGTYKVRYNNTYVDQNNNASNYIINPQNEPTITINKRDLRIKLDQLSAKEYDGTIYDYSNEGYSLIGTLVSSHKLEISYGVYLGSDLVEPIHANTYQLKITSFDIYDSNNINVKDNYNVDDTCIIEIVINRREVELEFITIDNKEYDGISIDHYSESYDNFNVIRGSILSVDSVNIGYSYFDVYGNKCINDPVDAGIYYIHADGYGISGYSAGYNDYHFTCKDKYFEITKRNIEIKPNDFERVFGDDFTYESGYTYISTNQLVGSDTLYVASVEYYQNNMIVIPKNVGAYKIVITSIGGSYNPNNYDIKYNGHDDYATLTITKKILNISLYDINSTNEVTYDGNIYKYSDDYGNYNGEKELPYNHLLRVKVRYQKLVNGVYQEVEKMQNAGEYKVIYDSFEINEANNNYNYDVICDEHEPIRFVINKRNVELELIDCTITYGDALNYPEVQYSEKAGAEFIAPDNVKLSIKVMDGVEDCTNKVHQLHAGEYTIDATISQFFGSSIYNYDITINTSTLTVEKRYVEIALTTNEEYTFDGNYHYFDVTNFEITNGELKNNDQIVITVIYDDGTITNPRNANEEGYTVSVETISIIGGVGNTSDYDIVSTNDSKLIIHKKEVIIDIDNCSMTYGSTSPLNIQFSVRTGYNFIQGDSVELAYSIYLNNTPVTSTLHKQHVREDYVISGSVANFTTTTDSIVENYDITIYDSTLTITQRYLEITLGNNYSYEYDAEYHEYSNTEFIVTDGAIVNDDVITITFTYNNKNSKPRDVGIYTVRYNGYKNNESYEDYDIYCDDEKTIEIYKKEIFLTISSDSKEYKGKIVYASSINYSLDIYQRDKSKVSVNILFNNTLTEIKNVGIYTINANVVDSSGNYTIIYNDIAQYEITKRDIIISPVVISDKPYDSVDVVYLDETGNYKTISGGISEEQFRISVTFYNSLDIPCTPKDADTYRVVIKDIFDATALKDNYNITKEETSFIIEKTIVKIGPKEMDSKVYRNTEYTYSNEYNNYDVFEGTFYGNDALNYRINVKFYDSINKSNEVSPKDAGIYYVFAYGIEGSNNNYEVSLYNNYVVFEIEKYTLNIDFYGELLPQATREYNGEYYSYATNGQISNCNYGEIDFEEISVVINPRIIASDYMPYSKVKDVDSYKLIINSDIFNGFTVYSYDLDHSGLISNNYTISEKSFNFKITKKTIRISINSVSDFEYGSDTLNEFANGFNQLDNLAQGDNTLTVKFKYLDLNDNMTYTSPKNAHQYKVVFDSYLIDGGESNNYDIDVTNEVTFRITRKALKVYPRDVNGDYPFTHIYDNMSFNDSLVHAYSEDLLTGDHIIVDIVKYYDENNNLLSLNPKEIGNYYVNISKIIIRDSDENDVTSNYEIDYSEKVLLQIVSERITITLKPIVTSKKYGDEIIYQIRNNNQIASITSELGIDYLNSTKYKFELDLEYVYQDEVVNPRDCKNYNITISNVYVYYDGTPKDSSMYNIELATNSILVISPKPIKIKAVTGQYSDTRNYNGEIFTVTPNQFIILDESNKLIDLPYSDESLTLETLVKDSNMNKYEGDILHADTYYVSIDPTSVEFSRYKANYSYTLLDAEIVINPAEVSIYAYDDDIEIKYDGQVKNNDMISNYIIYVNGEEIEDIDDFINDEIIHLSFNVTFTPFDSALSPYYSKDINTKELSNAGIYNIVYVGNYIENGLYSDYSFPEEVDSTTLTINRIELSFRTASGTWVYDGEEHSEENTFDLISGNLVRDYGHNHKLKAYDASYATITNVGKVDNVIDVYVYDENTYEFVGYNYIISDDNEWGILKVTPRPVTINVTDYIEYVYKSSDQTKIDLECLVSYSGLVDGENITKLTLKTPVRDAGQYEREVSVEIKKGDNSNSTANYDITINTINVKVKPMAITFELIQPTYYYNTLSHKLTKDDISYGDEQVTFYNSDISEINIDFLDEDDNIISEFVEVGEYSLRVNSFDIKNSSGETRISNYDYTITNADNFILTIVKRKIRISTKSDSKFFDGDELFNLGFEIDGKNKDDNVDEYADINDLLALGHEVVLADPTTYPSITYPDDAPDGTISNELVLKVVDHNDNDKDITDKYELLMSYGSLVITNKMNINSFGSIYYNGEPYSVFESIDSVNNYIKGNIRIAGKSSSQKVKFIVNDYIVLYREDAEHDYGDCFDYSEIGQYRLLLIDPEISINGNDITDTFNYGDNILNGGNTHNYYGEEYYYLDLEIKPIELYIRPKVKSADKKLLAKDYDGEGLELPIDFYEVLENELLPGHILEVYGTDSLDGTKVETKTIQFDEERIRVVYEKYDQSIVDVSRYYHINCTWDTVSPIADSLYTYQKIRVREQDFNIILRINRRTVNVIMPTIETYYFEGIEDEGIYTIYDGPSTLTYNSTYNIYLSEKTDSTGLINNDYIYITNNVNQCSLKRCGNTNNVLRGIYTIYDEYGNDVSSNYIVKSLEGKLIINPSIKITFKSDGKTKVYDGSGMSYKVLESITIYDAYNECYLDFEEFMTERGLEFETSNWATTGKKPGDYENYFDVAITKDGKKLSASSLKTLYGLEIEKEYGTLTIEQKI